MSVIRSAASWLSWLLLVSLLLTAPAAAENRASLSDIEDEVMCPICGTTLELSDSPQANRERDLIRRLIEEGRTKDEIKDRLVAEYGQDVLALPEAGGFDLTAWIVPGLGLAVAVVGLGFGVLKMTRRDRSGDQNDAELSPSDAARLDRDLSSYDT